MEQALKHREGRPAEVAREEELWARGEPFPWSHLIRYFRSQDENYTQIQAMFAADNWRSHRT